jgi:hypothetical protein
MDRAFFTLLVVLTVTCLGNVGQASCFGCSPPAGGCFSAGIHAPQLALDVPHFGHPAGHVVSLRTLRALERQRELERLARQHQAAILRGRLVNGQRLLPLVFNPFAGRPLLSLGIGF